MSVTDNEWAAGVMGWEYSSGIRGWWSTQPDPRDGTPVQVEERHEDDWSPDTDANDFRDLLNCEAVKEGWAGQDLSVCGREDLREAIFVHALWDQPAALRRLREAMEEQK